MVVCVAGVEEAVGMGGGAEDEWDVANAAEEAGAVVALW